MNNTIALTEHFRNILIFGTNLANCRGAETRRWANIVRMMLCCLVSRASLSSGDCSPWRLCRWSSCCCRLPACCSAADRSDRLRNVRFVSSIRKFYVGLTSARRKKLDVLIYFDWKCDFWLNNFVDIQPTLWINIEVVLKTVIITNKLG